MVNVSKFWTHQQSTQAPPLKLRDAFEDMKLGNTPLAIFDFIIFCRLMIKDLQAELELLKNV